MGNNRHISDLPRDIYTGAMIDAGISNHDTTTVMTTLSNTGKNFYLFFKETLKDRALRTLWQAVIDDHREQIKKILDAWPELLLIEPSQHVVIESQLTWQKFYAENPLAMACKRKQIKMIELLLPYYDKLAQNDPAVIEARTKALSCWSSYEMQKNTNDMDEIVIPKKYADYAQSLINVFAKETFPNGHKDDVALSEDTESTLSFLLNNILLPKSAVNLDDYLDPELFLLGLYNTACNNGFDKCASQKNWKQRESFCIRVLGIVQGVLSPETAKIFCESIYYVVEENREISNRAGGLKLACGESFYREARDSRSGLGFKYLCGPAGAADARCGGRMVVGVGEAGPALGKTMSSKNSKFLEYYERPQQHETTATTPRPTRS